MISNSWLLKVNMVTGFRLIFLALESASHIKKLIDPFLCEQRLACRGQNLYIILVVLMRMKGEVRNAAEECGESLLD
jgi:hypothetical protein